MILSISTLTLLALSLSAASAVETRQCIIPSKHKSSHGQASDSLAIEEAFAQCSQNSEIIFSEGLEYNVFSPLKATNLSNVVVRHLGNLNLPQNITYMQNLTAAAGGSLNWFDIRGTDVSWIGTEDVRYYDSRVCVNEADIQSRSPLGGLSPTGRPGMMPIPLATLVLRTAHTCSTLT